jgi:hypothetical protein
VGDALCPVEPRGPQQTAEESESVEQGKPARACGDDGMQLPEATRAAVRKAVQRKLRDEMEGHDAGRSARYVATVRPSQAAAKYVRSDVSGETTGKAGAALAEEGEPMDKDDSDAEEGGAATSGATTDSAATTAGTASATAATKASSGE